MITFFKKRPALAVFSFFSLVCGALLLAFRFSTDFSHRFAGGPAAFLRWALASISALFPFSVFEVLLALFALFSLFLAGLLLFSLIKKIRKEKVPPILSRCLCIFLVTLVAVGDLFCLTFAPCYFRESVASEMALDTQGVDREAVFFALERLISMVNETAPVLEKNENGESIPPYSLDEVKEKVREAADRFGEKHDFYQSRGRKAKSLLVSPILTYTHISGVYGFFTGEANVNTNYPHFIVTASIAHETCHARGIAPENECNFLASVILMESGDPYLAYCGASYLADDLLKVCRRLDQDRANDIYKEADRVLRCDTLAYSRFFDPYRDSTAAEVADKTNSAYLQSMGQKEGTVSYTRVIRLVSAYFQQKAS